MPSEIVVENALLIYSLARKFYGVEMDDLIQAGYLGLLKAYNKFNKESGTKFSTYAYGFIYGEMYEVATGNKNIKLRKPELKIYKGVIKTKDLLEAKYNRTVSYEEACAFLNVDMNYFMSILNAMSARVSVDETELNLSTEDNVDNIILLKESMSTLTPLERDVINSRYIEDLSQQETAMTLGLTQVNVSRIEKRSKEKMRNFIAS